MRLTADVIQQAKTYINPCKDRELDFRGFKIPFVENLGATNDQYDAIDFTDNDLQKLDNFPVLKRLKTLLCSNNRVKKLGEGLGRSLPSLDMLVLTNNKIESLAEVKKLAKCGKLAMLVLTENPVCRRQHYRLFTIHHIPSLSQLDHKRVTLEEKLAAKRLFQSQAGQAMERDVVAEGKGKTFTPGEKEGELTAEQRQQMSKMIENAKTPEEVDRLETMMLAGVMPKAGGAAAPEAAPPAPPAAPEVPAEAMEVDDSAAKAGEAEKAKAAEAAAKAEKEAAKAKAAQEAADATKAAAEAEPAAEDAMEEEAPAEQEDRDKPSEAEIKAMKVADLKKELSARDLSTSGLKAALQARLLEALGYA